MYSVWANNSVSTAGPSRVWAMPSMLNHSWLFKINIKQTTGFGKSLKADIL